MKKKYWIFLLSWCLVFSLGLPALAQSPGEVLVTEYLERLELGCELDGLSFEVVDIDQRDGHDAYIVSLGDLTVIFTTNHDTQQINSVGIPVGDAQVSRGLFICIAAFFQTPEEMRATSPIALGAERMIAAQTAIDEIEYDPQTDSSIEYSDGDLIYRYNFWPETGQTTLVFLPCREK